MDHCYTVVQYEDLVLERIQLRPEHNPIHLSYTIQNHHYAEDVWMHTLFD